ncbi:MAG: putative toxin-antitoxin system toxin component, PIN family [Candidatus Thermoplasmatota archaeon]
MVRVVADTNILVSAVIAAGKPRVFLQRCIAGDVTLVTSPFILGEFAEVLQRPKFKMGAEEVRRALTALAETAEIIEPRSTFRVVHDDPDDDAVLHVAHDGHADFIVSGDKHLLDLKEFEGRPILTVAEFLAREDT